VVVLVVLVAVAVVTAPVARAVVVSSVRAVVASLLVAVVATLRPRAAAPRPRPHKFQRDLDDPLRSSSHAGLKLYSPYMTSQRMTLPGSVLLRF
jgi:energy-converting hydrogenase Eha subunit F